MVTLDAPEGIVHTEANATLFFGDRDRGCGTLHITENYILWRGSSESDTLTLEYPSISLHAISRDRSNFPHECLYLLLESPESVSEEERDPEAEVTEVRFVPESEDNIKAMYDAITECQELHPDPDDVDSDEEGAHEDISSMLLQGQFYTADNMPENIQLSEEGQAVLARLNIASAGNVDEPMNGVSNGNGHTNDQFEDADEDME